MTVSNNDENRPPILLEEAAVQARTHGTLATPEQLAEQHQRFLAAATSDNTRRTYRSAIRHFQAWGGVLPCDEVLKSNAALLMLIVPAAWLTVTLVMGGRRYWCWRDRGVQIMRC